MNKSGDRTMIALVRLALLGGTLAFAPIVQAQIDFSGLEKWRGLPAQRGPVVRPQQRDNSSKIEKPREPTQKEIQKSREQAERMVATIRGKLSKPEVEASVSWSNAVVNVGATGGYFNTPPSTAGVFAAVAAGTAKTPATSMTPLALRRAAAILARAAVEGEETAAFLAGEAATAMEGGNLRVRVDDAAFKWNERREEQFQAVLQEAEEGFKDIEFAESEQARVDKEILSIAKSVQEGTLSADRAETKKRDLSDALEKALTRSREAEKKLRTLPKKIEYIVISSGKQ